MNKQKPPSIDELSALELMRIVPLSEAARLSGLSARTLQRNHSDKVIRMSPGRIGMRVRDALMIGGGSKAAS